MPTHDSQFLRTGSGLALAVGFFKPSVKQYVFSIYYIHGRQEMNKNQSSPTPAIL